MAKTLGYVITTAIVIGITAASVAQAAPTDQQRCQQAKLKAQAKYAACIAKSRGGQIVGKADDSADCLTKFTAALTKIDAKAAAQGTSCRYIDNGDGTASDLNNGLMWEQKVEGDDCPHCVNDTFTWSTGSPFGPDGTAFKTFLYALNGATSNDGTSTVTACFAGHCDWRLPTVQELQGIVDLDAPGCASLHQCIDPAFGLANPDYTWAATVQASSPNGAWVVNFDNGDVGTMYMLNLAPARAVRGGL